MPARRLLIAVCALALTACTPLIDDPSSPSTAAPAASETPGTESTTADAQAPTFELGEFDPEGDFELFDPCTEIPAEVLTEAGLGEMIGEPVLDGTDSILCSFVPLPERQLPGLFTLTTDRAPKSRIEELGFMISEEAQSQVPGTYLHHMGSHGDNLCHAAVHTVRGRFHVGYGEINPPQSRVGERTESCTIAVQTLESINSKMGETNGAVN